MAEIASASREVVLEIGTGYGCPPGQSAAFWPQPDTLVELLVR